MTTDDDFDRQIQAYLESGPAELADRVLWAARAQLKTTRRRRSGFAWLAPWRNPNVTQSTRMMLVGGGALIAVIGVALFWSIIARPAPGPAASAAPSAPGFTASPSASSSSVAPDPSPSVLAATAPEWSATGEMTEARSGQTATLLPDGRVLVAGGRIGSNPGLSANSAELYDPSSGTWSATGSMQGARDSHTATLLQNGTVLVAGGMENQLATAEHYDPSSGTWTATGGSQLAAGRGHTATLLPNGKVLVVGGDGNPLIAELYDPADGTWTATRRPMIKYHIGHTATLLSDGRVLVAGSRPSGRDDGSPTAELYDPSTGSWTLTGNMVGIRLGHTATLLPDGRVLVAGGSSEGNSKSTASTEVYDPGSGSWTATGDMIELRIGGWTATALTDGMVLVVGGFRSGGGILASAELFDPSTGTWTAAPNMDTPHANQTATLLPDGRVLVAGGMGMIDGTERPMASAELYDPGVGN